jgi:hypothetical protein
MSSYPSISIPSVPIQIPYTSMPTSILFSSGGLSFGFIMGSGDPSTSAYPMCGPTSSGAGVTFVWSMPSGFWVFFSHPGRNNTSISFPFPWVNTPFPSGKLGFSRCQ